MSNTSIRSLLDFPLQSLEVYLSVLDGSFDSPAHRSGQLLPPFILKLIEFDDRLRNQSSNSIDFRFRLSGMFNSFPSRYPSPRFVIS